MAPASSALLFASLLIAGCGAAPAVDETPSPVPAVEPVAPPPVEPVAPEPAAATVEVRFVLGDGVDAGDVPEGPLLVGYFIGTEIDDQARGELSLRTVRELISRMRVDADPQIGEETMELQVPAGRVQLFGMLGRDLWLTFAGAGPDGNMLGFAEEAEAAPGEAMPVDVPLSPVPAAGPREERCAGERMRLVRIEERAVRGTIGNETTRRLCVWLPPSYGEAPRRRYPVLYLFPGQYGTDTNRLSGDDHVGIIADRVAGETAREMLLVGVDTSSRAGSTYLEDTTLNGRWETFLTKRVVREIDRRFRTHADREGRGVSGQSTGGFNAISIGLRHPELFGVVTASAPDELHFPSWFLEADGARFRPWVLAWFRLDEALGGPGQMTSYAADWSPDPSSPRGFVWPVDLGTGAVIASVWARWVARSPTAWLDDAAFVERIRGDLSGRILVAASRGDEFDLFEPAEQFSRRLTEVGIEHRFVATDGGHFDTTPRFEAAVEFAAETLRPAAP